VKQGEEVTLAFKRTTDKTCATEVILHVNEKDTVEKKLPLNEVVPVTVTFSKTGELGYACGMNMYKGVIVVQ
jgi:plastocyanin domain-containing protein